MAATDLDQHPPTVSHWHGRLALAIWIFALAASIILDRPVARWIYESGLGAAIKEHGFREVVKQPGNFVWAAAIAAVLALWHPLRWRAGLFMLLTGTAGLVNSLVKWGIGRSRPFRGADLADHFLWFEPEWFRGGLKGVFHQTNLAFPSGHVSVAFATSTALAILFPRYRLVWFAIAAAVGIERIIENAHYLSDVVAAAGLSILVVDWIWRRWFAGPRPPSSRQRTVPLTASGAGMGAAT